MMSALFRRGALLAVALAAGAPAGAAGLLELYRQAQDDDPVLRRADAERSADREALPQARALWLPLVGADASALHSFDVEPTAGDASFNSRTISIQLRQPLFDRARSAQLEQAGARVEQTEAVYDSSVDELFLRVAQAYFDILAAQDDLDFVQADKNAIARQLEQARQRFEVGLITIIAVQEARARFDSVSADEIVARNTLADRKEALRRITGEFEEPLARLGARMPLAPPDPADTDAWVALALVNNPALEAARHGVDVADVNVDLQRAGHYPTLDLVASYSDGRRDGRDNSGGQIGLQLNVPIFEGFAVVSRTREAAFRLEAAKALRETRQRGVVTEVRNAYRGVIAAISQVEALDQARTSTRSALAATEAGFDVGTRTIVDVLNAQRDVFSAERNYALARYVYVLNWLRLKQAAGVIDADDIAEVNGWLRDPGRRDPA